RRRYAARFIPGDSSVCADDYAFTSVVRPFSEDCKYSLRGQALFNIQTRDDRAKLIVKRNLQQAVADRSAPNLLRMIIVSTHNHSAGINSGRDFLQLACLKQVKSLFRPQ